MLERARDFIALKTLGQCDIGAGLALLSRTDRRTQMLARTSVLPPLLVGEGYAGCQAMSRGVISGAWPRRVPLCRSDRA